MTARDDTVDLFELRFCDVAPGRLDDEIERVRTSAYSGENGKACLFEQFGVPRPLAVWTTAVGTEHRLCHLMHWPSLDARERSFVPLLASPEWTTPEMNSPGAPQVESVEAWLLGASRIWLPTAATTSRIAGVHEMRVQRIAGGRAEPVGTYLAEIEHPQIHVLGGIVLGVFDLLFGPAMPAIITFIAWPYFATQRRATSRLHVEPRALQRRHGWKTEYGETLVRATERTLLRPLPFALPRAHFGVRP